MQFGICVTHLLRNSPKKDPNIRKRKSTMTRRYKACPTMDSQHCGKHIRWVNKGLYGETNVDVFNKTMMTSSCRVYRKPFSHHIHPVKTQNSQNGHLEKDISVSGKKTFKHYWGG